MKKTLLKILGTSVLLLSTANATFANTTSIGLVDTQKIIENSTLYSELRKAEADLLKLQKNFEKEYMEKVQKLQSVLEQKKNPQEFQKLQDQYRRELMEKQSSAQKTLAEKQRSLETTRNNLRKKVEIAIKEIAKQKKLDYVVDKQMIFFGGSDITNDVLKKIK